MMKQQSGSIINLGSYGGKVGFPGYAAYCASKSAVHTLTISLARELAPYNINVNALCPGLAAAPRCIGALYECRSHQPQYDL